ncbi:MAG: FkbM family methyltransferase [Phycisphaeraceae bacterium]|nr:FkbM family methyltransferase [Phycisphaeraceae bacterium]
MRALRKLALNFSPRACRVLGVGGYARYGAALLRAAPTVIRRGELRDVDRLMGRRVVRVRYRGRPVTFDCLFMDAHIRDGTYAFGLIRELAIRDCYLRHMPAAVVTSARRVIDIGANRGTFSTLLTPWAQRIVAVEVLPEMAQVIQHNMRVNHFTGCSVVQAFMGSGGKIAGLAQSTMTMPQLLDSQGLEAVDLLKMDIEGSEFALFADSRWLDRVGALTMEVHPQWGDPATVLGPLRDHGFTCRVMDQNLTVVSNVRQAEFICAHRPAPTEIR